MASIKKLVNQCGTKNIPGIKINAWAICECDIADGGYPDLVATTTPGDSLRLDGDFTLAVGKGWAPFTLVSDTGLVKDTMVGATGSKSFQSTFDFKIPNTGAPVAEWFNDNANGCAIVCVEDKNGNKRIIGKIGIPALMEAAEGSSGDAPDSESVWTAQFKSAMGHPAYYYSGVITEAP